MDAQQPFLCTGMRKLAAGSSMRSCDNLKLPKRSSIGSSELVRDNGGVLRFSSQANIYCPGAFANMSNNLRFSLTLLTFPT